MKKISILGLLLLTSCSSINFARDEALLRRDEISDNHSETAKIDEGK
jgi:hypothetical protein